MISVNVFVKVDAEDYNENVCKRFLQILLIENTNSYNNAKSFLQTGFYN